MASGDDRKVAVTVASDLVADQPSSSSTAQSAAPMTPALLRSVAGTISVSMSMQRQELVGLLADPATDDEQVGGEEHLEGPVVLREPLGPVLHRELVALPRAVGGPGLGVVAVDLEVAELGVRDQDAVVDERGADAGPERGEDDQARAALRGAVPRLREAGRVRVVDHVHVAAGGLGEQRVGVGADPGLVDVRGRVDDAVPHHARDGDADRTPWTRGSGRAARRRPRRRRRGSTGEGVLIRSRSAANSPCSRSTGAPLMPVPPKSMPKGRSATPPR